MVKMSTLFLLGIDSFQRRAPCNRECYISDYFLQNILITLKKFENHICGIIEAFQILSIGAKNMH